MNLSDKIDSAVSDVTSYLLDNTDDGQGFEEIPDLDSARTTLMELQEDLAKGECHNHETALALLEASKVGLFAERDSCDEAMKYAQSMFLNDAPAITTAIMVYHNTLLSALAKSLSKSKKPAEPTRFAATVKYSDLHPMDYLDAVCGFIPSYFSAGLLEGGSLKDRVSEGYIRTSGFQPNWHDQPETKLSEDGSYAYPEDPVLEPLLTVSFEGQKFYLYDYGLAAYRSAPEAAPEFCRLD
jgi:hypothetical protein